MIDRLLVFKSTVDDALKPSGCFIERDEVYYNTAQTSYNCNVKETCLCEKGEIGAIALNNSATSVLRGAHLVEGTY